MPPAHFTNGRAGAPARRRPALVPIGGASAGCNGAQDRRRRRRKLEGLDMTPDELQKQHEAALTAVIAGLAGKGRASDWALARALVHKAVHLVADQRADEFCAVATFLAEMITHAHGLLHPGDPAAPAHGAMTH